MSWLKIKQMFKTLKSSADTDKSLEIPWREFVNVVKESENAPPLHMMTVLNSLKLLEKNRNKKEIVILDHGCGTAINVFYLYALGYENVSGANVIDKAQKLNRVFNELLGIKEERIYVYDGHKLPVESGTVDLILSQQVVEHVPDEYILDYYEEEGRVLRKGGVAIHHVPHRLMPYDSHTRTWFIHYLPLILRDPIYKLFGRDPAFVKNLLHLRFPGYHYRKLKENIGSYQDYSLHKLNIKTDADTYDGYLKLRELVSWLLNLPLIGLLSGFFIRNMVCLETVSSKR